MKLKLIRITLIILLFYLANIYGLPGWEDQIPAGDGSFPVLLLHDSKTVCIVRSKKGQDLNIFKLDNNSTETVRLPVQALSSPFYAISAPVIQTDQISAVKISSQTTESTQKISVFASEPPTGPAYYFLIPAESGAGLYLWNGTEIKPQTNLFNEPDSFPQGLFYNRKTGTLFVFYSYFTNERHKLIMKRIPQTNNQFNEDPSDTVIQDTPLNTHGTFFPSCVFQSNKMILLLSRRSGEGNRRSDRAVLFESETDGTDWQKEKEISPEGLNIRYPSLTQSEGSNILLSFSIQTTNGKDNLMVMERSGSEPFTTTEYTNFNYPFYFPRLMRRGENRQLTLFAYGYTAFDKAYLFERGLRMNGTWKERTPLSPTNSDLITFSILQDGDRIWTAWDNSDSKIRVRENDSRTDEPVIYCETISPGHETSDQNPLIKWDSPYDPSGISGYSYLLDNSPDSIPDIQNLNGEVNGKSFNYLFQGTWYFHLRAIDGAGNWSPVSTYKFVINTDPLNIPEISSPGHPEFQPVEDQNPIFHWSMKKETRKIRGYSYLLSQDRTLEPADEIQTRKTNISFTNLQPGLWYFLIKAVDENGLWSHYAQYTINIQETILASEKIEYLPEDLPPVPPATSPVPEENLSAITYRVKHGDNLSRIITRVLGLQSEAEHRLFLKEIAVYNNIQDPDLLRPGDKIYFPVIIAENATDLDEMASELLGSAKEKHILINYSDPEQTEIQPGDMILVKEKYFLKTGKIRKQTQMP